MFLLAYSISSQSIYVIECPEFRKLLLLLRPELFDADIPHRTKIRESIIKAWESWFQILKKTLSVRIIVTSIFILTHLKY
jgi:hypothetical protein